ncbi:hypothetical protein H2Y54_01770 [Pectobacterium aroidearum]|uniref:hypothetical protein n=1 Tax=Pectobacterium aroidearum TaxID=1201031 RepID=UPI0015F03B8F|nr:hypothetical protein [Pectobacterium aroidearum]MBA5235282.1 hypothetical protein [Pectobacterium aroidearum]
MSGTKKKTAGQQKPTDSTGAASSTAVASLNESNSNGHEPAIVLPGHYIPVGSQPILPSNQSVTDSELSASDVTKVMDVEALWVQAVSTNGFYRCGRFWPFDGVHVFVSDDPDGDNAESVADSLKSYFGVEPSQPFISVAVAKRLKADPQLRVTVIQTVTAESQGE